MGFYGNITNVANTTFQFDKIYPNRLDMEAHCNSDGIMVGRYVLVEYDQSAGYPVIYVDASGYGYPSSEMDANTRIKYGSEEGQFTTDEIGQNQSGKTVIFYRCSGVDSGYAIFEEVTSVTSESNYIKNFAIDEGQYAVATDKFTGFDSTVWVKTSNNTGNSISTHYVNIADLNSVVPTFDIAADAPTMTPIMPHYDADSTNVYYKLHMQQPFGFRIAKNEKRSDVKTTHYKYDYNSKEGITKEVADEDIPADIYFNKAGFEPYSRKYIEPSEDPINNPDNYIKIAPTGESGNGYSHAADTGDIQELSIQLPAIGNMMSDAWDIIHGPNRDDAQTDENSSLQGRLNSFKNMSDNQIPVKRDADGTFVGTTINGATHYNVTKIEDEPLLNGFDTDDAWIQTTINTFGLKDGSKDAEASNNGIAIHHTWTKGEDTTSNIDINNHGDTFNIVTPIADKAGHIVAHNTETVTLPYGYKSVTVGVQSTATDNPDVNTTEVTADNVKDNLIIGSSNKWIRMSGIDGESNEIKIGHEVHTPIIGAKSNTNINGNGDTITIQDIEFDEAGHMTANQKHTYTLPFGFKTITVPDNSTSVGTPPSEKGTQTADNTQDTLNIQSSNKWIKIDGATEDTIKLGHVLATGQAAGLHDSTDKSIASFGDSFNIVNFTTDEAGHVVASGTTTITTPIGNYETGTTTNNKTVLTGFEYTPSSGAIKTYSENVGTLKLSGYNTTGETTGTGVSLTSEDTINSAFAQIQTKINDMDQSSSGTTTFISSITQTNGKITNVGRSKAGTLQLGVNSNDADITENSTLSAAIDTLLLRIAQEKEARENAINTLYGDKNDISDAFDTIKEIADWLDGSDENSNSVEKLVESINKNTTAISKEQGRAEAAENNLLNKINDINVADTAQTNQYVSAVSQSGSKITVTRATLPVRSVTTGSANGTISVNGSNVKIQGLGSAAYTNSEEYVSKTGYEDKIANLEKTIADLTRRIEALENPTVE